LHFKKPAGLVVDVSGCGPIPSNVFIRSIEDGELIKAVYSTWWHTLAAPIAHFSGYIVAL
jgi:hypothetical protein